MRGGRSSVFTASPARRQPRILEGVRRSTRHMVAIDCALVRKPSSHQPLCSIRSAALVIRRSIRKASAVAPRVQVSSQPAPDTEIPFFCVANTIWRQHLLIQLPRNREGRWRGVGRGPSTGASRVSQFHLPGTPPTRSALGYSARRVFAFQLLTTNTLS